MKKWAMDIKDFYIENEDIVAEALEEASGRKPSQDEIVAKLNELWIDRCAALADYAKDIRKYGE